MGDESRDGVVVLEGESRSGLLWAVSVDHHDRHLIVMLNVFRGDRRLSSSGFDGSVSSSGTVLEQWWGRTDDLPYFVMARTAGTMTRVVATTSHGTDIELKLSAFIPEYGSRFAAVDLPDGEFPSTIRAEREGTVIATARQHVAAPRNDA